ncbi:RNA polymerase sigma factor [Kordiimonas gwangyangensis]|uniref:RNA polymerase sigma factor n=1 Tax=Kordiimonas gwangyangensis TaxID=288022 RepID=UPI00038262CF|nr:DUF6596 domain-containing protein [Kordiimonas gwangyangensis]
MAAGHDTEARRELDRLFRREAGRLVATLVKRLGPHHLSLAEDTAQEALTAAARTWPYDGLPENPAAWLQATAYRKAIDELRHIKVAQTALPELERAAQDTRPIGQSATDSELELLFLCCQPNMAEMDRVALTLNIAFGFSAREIAQLFYATPAAMSARLTRAKERAASVGLSTGTPLGQEAGERMPTVLKVIYLAFSLGYRPGPGPVAVREDIALEALRLAQSLALGPWRTDGTCHALAALLSFQASRLATRRDDAGHFTPLAQQDRTRWDKDLIAQGFVHLSRARQTAQLGRYHIEAGIAAAHVAGPSVQATDWAQIIALYETLEVMTGSAIVTLNKAAAIAAAGRAADALNILDELADHPSMRGNIHYHTARADVLSTLGRQQDAKAAFKKARFLPGSDSDLAYLDGRLAALD